MSTQPAVSTQQDAVHEELKAERVQDPVATFRTQLKAERVQEGLAAAGAEMEAKPTFTLELAVYQPQTVTFELFASKVAITLHGIASVGDSGIAG
jgi:hypothetical protein